MKKWILKNNGESPQIEGIHPNIAKILYSRGICTKEDMEEFLSDAPVRTYDPFLMKGMKEAVEKILEHVKRGSRICIYGDYDVDGVTAICLLFEFLQNLTKNLSWYVPARQGEGYGINKAAIKKIKDAGTDLMISVDCGISSRDEIEYASELGLDVIVTDHHTPGEKIPECIILNPKQEGCGYPFKELCGCGVAYKLIQAIQRTLGLEKKTISRCLDLVVTATVADIVPLLDENRTLVKYGLKELNRKRRPGMRSLIKAIGLEEKVIGSSDIAFQIGPHINAGGRVDTAETSLKLLLEQSVTEAEALADRMVYNNNLRKNYQNEGIDKAIKFIESREKSNLILVSGQDIHEGVAGIVAGKLKDEYGKPALIVTENKEMGVLKGTGRSIDAINLYDFLDTQREHFLTFGGHKAACGFSIKLESLEEFRAGLERELDRMIADDPDILDEIMEIDDVLDLANADNDFGWMLKKLEPYGQKNQNPVFMIEDVIIDDMHFVGKEREHCKFLIKDAKGHSMECIMFNSENRFRGMDIAGKRFDFVGKVNMNYRAGEYNIQFIPNDFRRSI